MNIIDISRDALKTEIYPGDPLPHAEFVSRIGENSSCNLSTLFSCVHTGTHADAPLHFIDGGAGIDEGRSNRLSDRARSLKCPRAR